MIDTKITPKEFAPLLIAVLGRMTEYTPDKPVHHESTYGPVCKAMGIDEDAFGVSSNGTTKTIHRQIGLAMRQLRDHGMTDYTKRGYWALTLKGVVQARVAAGLKSASEEASDELPLAARSDATAEEDLKSEGAEIFQLPVVGKHHPYSDDPYIRSLAVGRVNCFGAYARRKGVCKGCPIQVNCMSAVSARKAEIAAKLDAEEASALVAAQAQNAERSAKNASVDELIAKASADTSKAKTSSNGGKKGKYVPGKDQEVAPAFAQRETMCVQCDTTVGKDAACTWVQDEGIFHNDCIGQPKQ